MNAYMATNENVGQLLTTATNIHRYFEFCTLQCDSNYYNINIVRGAYTLGMLYIRIIHVYI